MKKTAVVFVTTLCMLLAIIPHRAHAAPKQLIYDSDSGYFSGAFETTDKNYMRIEIYTSKGYLNDETSVKMSVGSTAATLTSRGMEIDNYGDTTIEYLGRASLQEYDMQVSILQVSVPSGTTGWTLSMPVSQFFKEFIVELATTPVNDGEKSIITTPPIETLAYYVNTNTSLYTMDDIDDITSAEAFSPSRETESQNGGFVPIVIDNAPVVVDTLSGLFTLIAFISVVGTGVSAFFYRKYNHEYAHATSSEFVKQANEKVEEKKSKENELIAKKMQQSLEEDDYTDSDAATKPIVRSSKEDGKISPGDYVIDKDGRQPSYYKVENDSLGDVYISSTVKPKKAIVLEDVPQKVPKWAQQNGISAAKGSYVKTVNGPVHTSQQKKPKFLSDM